MNKFTAGTITVPSRKDVIKPVIEEFKRRDIPHIIYMDEEYKGHKWNITRMFMDMCMNHTDTNILITMDDILFKDGWFEKVNEILDNTDYDSVTLLTNKKCSADDVCGIRRATTNWWMYDHCVLFRQGVLTPEWFEDFMKFCQRPDKHPKEINHYDNMIGHFMLEKGYKCGTTRPNYVKMQDVKSLLGHNIVVKDN